MSVVRVSTLVNQGKNAPPNFSKGLTISGGQTIFGNVNVTGVCTATTFAGDGSGITNLPGFENGINLPKSYAMFIVL